MPLAERSLEHVISAERIAGRDLKKIRYFASDIGEALAYLHEDKGLVHADFKPRNIVRIGGDWKLIDFDAAVQVFLSFSALGTIKPYSKSFILSKGGRRYWTEEQHSLCPAGAGSTFVSPV
jgi:serine/threonine protein kinase